MVRTVKKPEERRNEIVKAARKLFQTYDYNKVTMQNLMESLNIAKGTIYHYFKSKQELLEAVVEDIVDDEFNRKNALLQSESMRDLPAIEKLKIFITDNAARDGDEQILDSLHHPENAEMHTRQLGRYIVKLAPLYAIVFEQGCQERVFKVKHPLEVAEMVLAGAQFLTDVGFYPWTEGQLQRRMLALPQILESLLDAPSGSFSFLIDHMSK